MLGDISCIKLLLNPRVNKDMMMMMMMMMIIRSPTLFFIIIFDQLKMSNHSLTAQGSDLLFSHKSVVSIKHEQIIFCSKPQLDSVVHNRSLFEGRYLQVAWFALGQ